MIKSNLIKQFQYCQRVIEMNTEGITQEESLRGPEAGGNCINWVAGHILTSRNSVLKLLGKDPVLGDEQLAIYVRGSHPDTQTLLPWSTLQQALTDSSREVQSGLEAASDDHFEAELPDGKDTVGGALAGLSFHEAYHVGQTGVIRRTLGKAGAIS